MRRSFFALAALTAIGLCGFADEKAKQATLEQTLVIKALTDLGFTADAPDPKALGADRTLRINGQARRKLGVVTVDSQGAVTIK